MIAREKVLLRLVSNEGGGVEKLRLMKLAFLLAREGLPRTATYEFLPFKHGPFSFTLYHDLRRLSAQGYLTERDKVIAVSGGCAGEAALDPSTRRMVDGFSASYRVLATSRLVDEVYARFPWFTINASDVKKRRACRPVGGVAVYTIGYEGMMLDGFLDLLLRAGIQRLLDVRKNPVARRYGFHRSTLERHCGEVGIEYQWLPELGVPAAWRTGLESPADYVRLFATYEREVLQAGLSTLRSVIEKVQSRATALMCMEQDQACCHRSRLAEYVSARTGLPIVELRGEREARFQQD